MSSATGDAGLRALWENDTVKIGATLLAFYVAYLALGTLLGYPIRGQINSLARLTFLIGVYAMLSLALNLHWGYTGIFNIGIAGFMAVAVYVMAIFTKPVVAQAGSYQLSGLGLPMVVGVLAGMVAAALVGFVVALPALRLRADYFAIVTIASSEIIRFILLSKTFQSIKFGSMTLGTGGGRGILFSNPLGFLYDMGWFKGLTDVFAPIIGSNPSAVVASLVYAAVLLVFVGGFYWLMRRTGQSPFGRVLKAIREDEDVANALGKNTSSFKIKSFMLGCALIGLAGIFWVGSRGQVSPNVFKPKITFYVWIALIIGGSGSNTGSVMGATLFVGLLFQGPLYIKDILTSVLDFGPAPNTIAQAFGPLGGGNVMPFLSYTLNNIEPLKIVLLGVILIWLVQNRPDGLLGHRKEIASSIDVDEHRGDGR